MSKHAAQRRAPLMGMNLELKRAGRAFHIQTEDLGVPRGELVTQLFISGTIIETIRCRYLNSDEHPPRLLPSEAQLRHQMRDQHLSLVRAVQAGRYDHGARAAHATPPSPPSVDSNPAPHLQAARAAHSPVASRDPSAQPTPRPPHPTQGTSTHAVELAPAPAEQQSARRQAPADQATLLREVSAVQRGVSQLGRAELLPELLCIPQRRRPDPAAQLLELKTCALRILDERPLLSPSLAAPVDPDGDPL